MSDIFTVTLPDIGEGVVEGEVTAWLKNEGDSLTQDEPVVEVMTDKATVELPAPYPGTLSKQYYSVGGVAIKDKPLYDIALKSGVKVQAKSKASVQTTEEPKAKPSPSLSRKANAAPERRKPRPKGERALATPPVRDLARKIGVDINVIPGSGQDGRVLPEDIHAFLAGSGGGLPEQAPPIPHLEGDEVIPLQGIRRLVAKKMTLSKKHIPHFGYCDKADVTLLVKFRTKNKEEAKRQGIHLTFMPLFIRALSLTIQEYPQINGSLDEANGEIIIHTVHNIGIAMKSPQGLTVPVLKGVEKMDFQGTVRAYHALSLKARENALAPEDMRESTITISNFGTEGGLWASPVINYPEAAIVATAKIQKQPTAKGNSVVIRDVLNCSWSFDHRIIDGDVAAAVSNHFITLLENPSRLL